MLSNVRLENATLAAVDNAGSAPKRKTRHHRPKKSVSVKRALQLPKQRPTTKVNNPPLI